MSLYKNFSEDALIRVKHCCFRSTSYILQLGEIPEGQDPHPKGLHLNRITDLADCLCHTFHCVSIADVKDLLMARCSFRLEYPSPVHPPAPTKALDLVCDLKASQEPIGIGAEKDSSSIMNGTIISQVLAVAREAEIF